MVAYYSVQKRVSYFLRVGPHYCEAFFTYMQNSVYTDLKLFTSTLEKKI